MNDSLPLIAGLLAFIIVGAIAWIAWQYREDR